MSLATIHSKLAEEHKRQKKSRRKRRVVRDFVDAVQKHEELEYNIRYNEWPESLKALKLWLLENGQKYGFQAFDFEGDHESPNNLIFRGDIVISAVYIKTRDGTVVKIINYSSMSERNLG